MDGLLIPYIRAKSDLEAEQHLETIVAGQAAEVVRVIVRSKLAGQDEAEDVESDALTELVKRIRSIRLGANEPIDDIVAYAATLAHNACHQFHRKAHPLRAQLQRKVRHALKSRSDFAIWTVSSGLTLCGFAHWQGQTAARPAVAFSSKFGSNDEIEEFLFAYFRHTGGPMEVRAAVEAAAVAFGVQDYSESLNALDDQSLCSEPADCAPDPFRFTSSRMYAKQLWVEIRELPVNQRVALLLNVRDGAIQLFPACGVASIRDLAAALEIPAEKLAELWGKLPMDDNAIAAFLGVARQQVINLRMSAKKRLSNRLREWR